MTNKKVKFTKFICDNAECNYTRIIDLENTIEARKILKNKYGWKIEEHPDDMLIYDICPKCKRKENIKSD